jgi:hypothetical protein
MTDRELMQMALDALEGYARNCQCEGGGAPCDAAKALRARLAQPEPEPVAWGVPNTRPTEKAQFMMLLHSADGCQYPDQLVPLYTAPPKIFCGCGDQIMPDDGAECGTCVTARNAVKGEWQGLTENEIKHLWYEACQTNLELTSQLIVHLARNIEAKLKERNT